MTGRGKKFGIFPFWRFAQEGSTVEQPGSRELAPSRGGGRRPNWRKDLKILILFHSFLFNFRMQNGRGAVKENSLGSPGYRQKGPVPSSGRDLGGSLICELGFTSLLHT